MPTATRSVKGQRPHKGTITKRSWQDKETSRKRGDKALVGGVSKGLVAGTEDMLVHNRWSRQS